MSARRLVGITCLGAFNPIGHSVPEYWKNLIVGKSGIGAISMFDTTNFKVKFGGEVKQFDTTGHIEPRELRRLDRFCQFAVVAANEAIKDSGLDLSKVDPFRAGVILGSGIGVVSGRSA